VKTRRKLSKRLVVDRVKCQATGYCVKIAPHLFKLEGPGPVEFAQDQAKEGDLELMFEAEDTCPTRAISVVD
jgi:ferredoxin